MNKSIIYVMMQNQAQSSEKIMRALVHLTLIQYEKKLTTVMTEPVKAGEKFAAVVLKQWL